MEENIIEQIAQAEAEAERKKSEASESAALLLAEAERAASAVLRAAETDCAIMRAEGVAKAEREAEESYGRALAAARKEAREYADGVLGRADVYVAEIVGRVVK